MSEQQQQQQSLCSVCLDSLKEEQENYHLTPCGHAFHLRCLREWLGRIRSCPLCQNRLDLNPLQLVMDPSPQTVPPMIFYFDFGRYVSFMNRNDFNDYLAFRRAILSDPENALLSSSSSPPSEQQQQEAPSPVDEENLALPPMIVYNENGHYHSFMTRNDFESYLVQIRQRMMDFSDDNHSSDSSNSSDDSGYVSENVWEEEDSEMEDVAIPPVHFLSEEKEDDDVIYERTVVVKNKTDDDDDDISIVALILRQ